MSQINCPFPKASLIFRKSHHLFPVAQAGILQVSLMPSCPSTCGQSVLLTAALLAPLSRSHQPPATSYQLNCTSVLKLPSLHTAHSYSPISPHGSHKVSFKVSCAPFKASCVVLLHNTLGWCPCHLARSQTIFDGSVRSLLPI